jgi:hypothetical protein
MATALVAAVHAAPSKSPTAAADDALQRLVVNYNYTTAAEIAAEYADSLYKRGHSNAVKAAAPVVSKEILPYCVGLSSDRPVRVKLFQNQQTCDGNGFRTLWVFTAHSKKDKHHGAYPVCIASATKPDRSMLFNAQTKCTGNGWKTDFVFYMSGQYSPDPAVSNGHESTMRWVADNDSRMLMYPEYDGASHGWTSPFRVGYRSRWRLAGDREMGILRAELPKHATINNQVSVVPPPNTATQWCAQNLIQVYNWGALIPTPNTLPGTVGPNYANDAARDECAHLVPKSFIRMGRVNVDGFIPVEILIDNKVHAAVSLKANTNINAAYVRLALQESLRTGAPLPVVVDPLQGDLIVTLISGTIAVIGGTMAYQHPI